MAANTFALSLEDESAASSRHGRVAVGTAEPPQQYGAAARRQKEPLRPCHDSLLDGSTPPARDGLEVQARQIQEVHLGP